MDLHKAFSTIQSLFNCKRLLCNYDIERTCGFCDGAVRTWDICNSIDTREYCSTLRPSAWYIPHSGSTQRRYRFGIVSYELGSNRYGKHWVDSRLI